MAEAKTVSLCTFAARGAVRLQIGILLVRQSDVRGLLHLLLVLLHELGVNLDRRGRKSNFGNELLDQGLAVMT